MTPYDPPQGVLSVAHADEALIVAIKPSGLLSVPGRGPDKADCLATRLAEAFGEVFTVHRLDMETSGLTVLARTQAAQRTLSAAFAGRRVAKTYEARIAGWPAGVAGEIDLPLIADWPNRPRQKVDARHGKPSRTRWRLLSAATEVSRVELVPATGRTHQLRLHMAATGHPILGDTLYAPEPVRSAADRLQLHATQLAFKHPASGEPLAFRDPAPF